MRVIESPYLTGFCLALRAYHEVRFILVPVLFVAAESLLQALLYLQGLDKKGLPYAISSRLSLLNAHTRSYN